MQRWQLGAVNPDAQRTAFKRLMLQTKPLVNACRLRSACPVLLACAGRMISVREAGAMEVWMMRRRDREAHQEWPSEAPGYIRLKPTGLDQCSVVTLSVRIPASNSVVGCQDQASGHTAQGAASARAADTRGCLVSVSWRRDTPAPQLLGPLCQSSAQLADAKLQALGCCCHAQPLVSIKQATEHCSGTESTQTPASPRVRLKSPSLWLSRLQRQPCAQSWIVC